jgi:hypothetical protein
VQEMPKVTIVDGQTYREGETPWDLGSFECVGTDGNKRFYSGLSVDAPHKLPRYANLGTDSTAKCLDNGDFYYYHNPSREWYKQ